MWTGIEKFLDNIYSDDNDDCENFQQTALETLVFDNLFSIRFEIPFLVQPIESKPKIKPKIKTTVSSKKLKVSKSKLSFSQSTKLLGYYQNLDVDIKNTLDTEDSELSSSFKLNPNSSFDSSRKAKSSSSTEIKSLSSIEGTSLNDLEISGYE